LRQNFQRKVAKEQRVKEKILNPCLFATLRLCVKFIGLRRSFVGWLKQELEAAGVE
jgi:hypothetical protein